jgi:hypothetical protein
MTTLRVLRLALKPTTVAPPSPVTRLRVLRLALKPTTVSGQSGITRLRVLSLTLTTDPNITANAGQATTVDSQDVVVLSSGASSSTATSWTWTQTAGPTVVLRPSNTVPNPEFTAPATDTGTVVTHSLVTRNAAGTASAPSTVSVTVLPHIEWLYLGNSVWKPVLRQRIDLV